MAENRREFQQLARLRLSDAKVLLANGRDQAAYYMTGLAVECAIKACVSRNTKRHDFPPDKRALNDIYTHNLIKLVGAAKLQSGLDAERNKSPSFKNNWDVVKDWDVSVRYVTSGLNARDLYKAVAGRNGIMQWLRQNW
jgi:hypothetical protein